MIIFCTRIGEACRPVFNVFVVNSSYALAMIYVIADSYDKAKLAIQNTQLSDIYNKKSAIAASDTFIWHAFASIAIPGFTINQTVRFVKRLTRKHRNVIVRTVMPTFTGLASIPIILKPIDNGTDVLMDNTFRRIFPNEKDNKE